ncbi:MAG: phosphate regulon sensor histidine kinase PhoR [Alphaproteobacteria bacterium]|nr:phosphate regulon sensor histidine kinase PhoR [Alphaproteobacteria bacterium]
MNRKNRFQRPRKLARISLRSALPAWAVLILLVAGGSLAFRHALLGGLLAAVLAVLVAWRPARLRDALRHRIDSLAADERDPGRPELSDGLNWAFERLVSTWRAKLERLAAESSERPHIMDAMPDPILLVRADRTVTRANRAARDVAGINIAGYDIAVGLRNPDLVDAVDRVLGGASGQAIEITFPVPVERRFAVRVEPLGAHLPDAAVVVFHDLTALEQTERMRADFVANVSHELKTPLTSLIGYIETLQGPARNDAKAQAKFLAIMDDQAKRMARLVDDLLSLARIEMDEHSRPTGSVPVEPILKETIGLLEPQAKKRNLSVALTVEADAAMAIGDRDQLAEVFENLIGNAIKYGSDGGQVTVVAKAARPGEISITVADDGEGIAPEHLPRLTERFYRVDAARSRERGGTGLGLAIVKHIVSRHRGRLSIESTPGAGSSFTVNLPAAVAPAGGLPDNEPATT